MDLLLSMMHLALNKKDLDATHMCVNTLLSNNMK